jgi:Zn-dependent M28 family amino/carboxypeptidase
VSIVREGAPQPLSADTSIDRFFLSEDAKAYVAKLRGAKAVLFTVERLTYGDVSEQWEIPAFRVRADALPEKIESISFTVQTGSRRVETNNVIARLNGTRRPDSTIILCAHYDHLGAIDDSLYFPGANDNASGTAMLLEMARVLKERPLPYSVLFLAFSGEEIGLRGSRYFVSYPRIDLRGCRFLLNFDMTASGNDGIMAVGGVDFPEAFALLQAVNDSLKLGELRKRANAPNSDQFFFVQKGVPGFYIYPYTGYQPYHHINDRPATLEWNVFEKLYRLFEAFLRRL